VEVDVDTYISAGALANISAENQSMKPPTATAAPTPASPDPKQRGQHASMDRKKESPQSKRDRSKNVDGHRDKSGDDDMIALHSQRPASVPPTMYRSSVTVRPTVGYYSYVFGSSPSRAAGRVGNGPEGVRGSGQDTKPTGDGIYNLGAIHAADGVSNEKGDVSDEEGEGGGGGGGGDVGGNDYGNFKDTDAESEADGASVIGDDDDTSGDGNGGGGGGVDVDDDSHGHDDDGDHGDGTGDCDDEGDDTKSNVGDEAPKPVR
jgi:hypothetical protein